MSNFTLDNKFYFSNFESKLKFLEPLIAKKMKPALSPMFLKKPFNWDWSLKSFKKITAVIAQNPASKIEQILVLKPTIISIGANISKSIAGYIKKLGRP